MWRRRRGKAQSRVRGENRREEGEHLVRKMHRIWEYNRRGSERKGKHDKELDRDFREGTKQLKEFQRNIKENT